MESEASREDKDKKTVSEMEESAVNKQNSDKSACGIKNEVDASTQRESSQTEIKQDAPYTKHIQISEAMIKEFEEQNFVKQVSKLKNPEKYGSSQFYCELCCVLFEKPNEVRNHISSRGHKKNKKSKGPMLEMKRMPLPSPLQIEALERMLEFIVKQQGLDPVEDLRARVQVKMEIQEIVESLIPGSFLTLYGSSLTCFGFKTSDVNLDLTLPKEMSVPQGLLSLLEVLQRNDKCIDVKDEFNLNTPQISFIHTKSGLMCHLSCGSKLVCKTSELLKGYAEINPVVRKLVVGFRLWAQSCCIDRKSDGGLTPYCFALMVIQFLQCTNPPVLPRLDVEEEISEDKLKFDTTNSASLGLLWFKLFRFYCVEFEIDENVISIRVKQPFSRETRRWGHRRFAIEDPYITGHNVSTVSSDKVFEYILCCMDASFMYFGTVPKVLPKEISHRSKNERNFTTKETQPKKVPDEVYEETESDQEVTCDKSSTKQTSSIKKQQKFTDDDIFQMDDIEDEDGADAGNEGETKTQGRDKEVSALENKMEKLNVMNVSQNTKTNTREQLTPATRINDESLNYQDTRKGLMNIELQIDYVLQADVLSGGRKPVVQCQVCKKDGHSSSSCPDLRKPALVPLPPLNSRLSDIVTNVCSKARELIAFLPEERKFRESVLWNLEDYIQEVFPDSQLHLFGSSMNGFGFKDSDLDICMTLDGKCKEDVDCISIINQLAKKLKQHKDCSNVVAITTAKVPIVKFYLRSVKREADISLYNVLALENTKMLATYAKLDDRVSILGYTLKLFAKVCDIGDASKGSLSSYAYILMLLHFLQKRDPPVIPVLQELYTGDAQPRNMIDGWNCWFYSDIQNLSKVWKSKMLNKESVGSLWIGFLRYYTETFDWEHEVVCCRRMKRLTKFERMWTRHIFAVEDPFNLDHNLGAGISRKMGTFIKNALVRGRERFGSPPVHGLPYHMLLDYYFHVDFLTNGYEAPNDRTCRVCGHIGHIARECPRHKKNRKEESRSEDRSKLSNRPFAMINTSPRKRAVTAPIMITRKEPVTEKSGNNLAGSLPNDHLPRDTKQASNSPAGITKTNEKSSVNEHSSPELSFKKESPTKEKPVTIQDISTASKTSQEKSHVSQTRPSQSNPEVISHVWGQHIVASIPQLQLSSLQHTETSNAPLTSRASSNFNQEKSRPGFGPMVQTFYASPGLAGKSVPLGVQLLPPEKFMSPPKGSGHPGGSQLQPFLSPPHLSGQSPDETRMLPPRNPAHISSGYPVRSENTINAWPPSPPFGAHYHSPQARKIPGQPRERPRSVSESMASPGVLSEQRIQPIIGSSPPVMVPIGSPPQVYRSHKDNPFWASVGSAGNYPGIPFQNVPSPTRHPSSLPSSLNSPHPNKNVEQANLLMHQQQHQVTQSSPPRLPQSAMNPTFGGNMSPEVFFNMVKEAEKQQTGLPSKNSQKILPKPIPSSDAVLSHPVTTPIFKPPKTADEKELFSKLDKVRGLWTSSTTDYNTPANSGDNCMSGQEKNKEVKPNSREGSKEIPVKGLREVTNDNASMELSPRSAQQRETDTEVSTKTGNQTSSSNKANSQPRSQKPNEGKSDLPSTLNEEMKNEALKGTESPVLKQQHIIDLKKVGKHCNKKTKAKQPQQQQQQQQRQQQQQASNDISKTSRKKQGLLGDKPGESSASEKKRQEKHPNKNADSTDSSNCLGEASEPENKLFDLVSFQKAFPSEDVDVETDSDRGSSSRPKPNKKQNRTMKSNGQNGQESRSSSQPSEETSPLWSKGKKKGGYTEEGVVQDGPARKRRKSKEGLCDNHREEVKMVKPSEQAGGIETKLKKAGLESPPKHLRSPRDNRTKKKQNKETTSEDKPGSFGEMPAEGHGALPQQGRKSSTPATPRIAKEDKIKGERKQSKDETTGKNRPSVENTTGMSTSVKTTPKSGERAANPSKTTKVTKEDVSSQEQGRGEAPAEKKDSPTSRSEDSGEESKGGKSGPKRKSKGRGRGRGRGRGHDNQLQPGPVSDGKNRPPADKHKGSHEAQT